MTIHRRTLLTSSLALAATTAIPPAVRAQSGSHLVAYDNETQLREALERWQQRSKAARQERREAGAVAADSTLAMGASKLAAQAAPAAVAEARADESITNVQTAGVDEGGIVKRAGDFLIVLRRGRLFTVRVGGDALQPVAAVDAYAPGSNPQGAWYDELLVSGRDVVVVGYSYARGGTEIGLFELDGDGGLRHRATHHLRSFDYYSSRNYASRLIGRQLIFYTPTLLSPWQTQPWHQFPALRRWQGEIDAAGFRRILPATRVYRTDSRLAAPHAFTAAGLPQQDIQVAAAFEK